CEACARGREGVSPRSACGLHARRHELPSAVPHHEVLEPPVPRPRAEAHVPRYPAVELQDDLVAVDAEDGGAVRLDAVRRCADLSSTEESPRFDGEDVDFDEGWGGWGCWRGLGHSCRFAREPRVLDEPGQWWGCLRGRPQRWDEDRT